MSNYKSYLNQVEKQIDSRVSKGLNDIGSLLKSESKAIVPVDTGELKRSIDSRVSNNSVDLGASASHAGPVELGSSRQPSQPYIEPAVMSNLSEIEDILNRSIGGK